MPRPDAVPPPGLNFEDIHITDSTKLATILGIASSTVACPLLRHPGDGTQAIRQRRSDGPGTLSSDRIRCALEADHWQPG